LTKQRLATGILLQQISSHPDELGALAWKQEGERG